MRQRHWDQVIEIEETLFGDFRITERWKDNEGVARKEVYNAATDEELLQVLDDIGITMKARKRLHLL